MQSELLYTSLFTIKRKQTYKTEKNTQKQTIYKMSNQTSHTSWNYA